MVRSLNKWQSLLLLSSYIILHYIPGAEPLLHFLSQLMHPSCWSLLPIFQEQLQTPCLPRLGPSIWEEVNIYTILGTVILMTVYIWGLEWRKTKSRDKLAGHWRRSDVGRGRSAWLYLVLWLCPRMRLSHPTLKTRITSLAPATVSETQEAFGKCRNGTN